MQGLALTKFMSNWLFKWLAKPGKHEELLVAIRRHYAHMPLWKGTAFRCSTDGPGVWHKSPQAARLGFSSVTPAYRIAVESAIDLEQVALFLAKWFPERRALFRKFAKSAPLLIIDLAKAKRMVTHEDVDWGTEEDDAADALDGFAQGAPSLSTEDGLKQRFSHGFSRPADMIDFMSQAWDVFNREYFKLRLGRANRPAFRTTLPKGLTKYHGRGGTNFYARGLWSPTGRFIFLNPRLFLNWKSWRQTMLHEMCHEAVWDMHDAMTALEDGRTTNGHGPLWQWYMKEIGEPVMRYDHTDPINYMYEDEKSSEEQERSRIGLMRGMLSGTWEKGHVTGDLVYFFDAKDKSQTVPEPGIIMARAPKRKSDPSGAVYFYVMNYARLRNPDLPWPRIYSHDIGTKLDASVPRSEFIFLLTHGWPQVFASHKRVFVK
jgi:predicted SprT family Zn-dependent metalloprotease